MFIHWFMAYATDGYGRPTAYRCFLCGEAVFAADVEARAAEFCLPEVRGVLS